MADDAPPTDTPSTEPVDDFTDMILNDAPQDTPAAPTGDDATDFANELLGDDKPDLEKVLEGDKPKDEEKPKDKEKPADEKPKDEDTEPETPSGSDDWKRLRESRNRYKAAAEERENFLKEREAELAEVKAKAARAAELEERLKAFDEQEKELALARVEATLEYKETIKAPLDAIGQGAEMLAQSNESDPDAVFRMLREADPVKQRTMLKEITSGWDEIDRLDLKKMADDARTLLDKQDQMRASAHAAAKEREELASKSAAESKDKARKEFTAVTGEVVKAIREKLPFAALTEGETEDDRYTLLAQKVAQVDFDTQTPKAKALAAASALALPKAIDTIKAKDREIAELKEALAKSTKSKPSVAPKDDAPPAKDGGDFFDNVGVPKPNFGF